MHALDQSEAWKISTNSYQSDFMGGGGGGWGKFPILGLSQRSIKSKGDPKLNNLKQLN